MKCNSCGGTGEFIPDEICNRCGGKGEAPILIGLTGMPKRVAQTGKSTVANYLVEKYGFSARGYADKLRSLALRINPYVKLNVQEHIKKFDRHYQQGYTTSTSVRLKDLIDAIGYEEAKRNQDVRRFYQNLGEGVRLELGELTWVESAYLIPLTGKDVFFDVRYNNEAEKIISLGGLVFAVDNPRVPPLEGDHSSEQGIDQKYIAGIIHNEGSFQDLYSGVDAMLKHYETMQ